MADDKNIRDNRDASRVAGDQDYEIQYLTEKLGVTRERAMEAINAVGPDRDKVEAYIRDNAE